MKQLLEIIQIARPGFWPTHLWFYLLPFARRDMFGSIPFWIGCVYVCFPLGLLLYGWNDLGDVATDQINQRKGNWLFGARPDERQRRQLPWFIAAVQLPFLLIFVSIAGAKMLIWFAAVLVANGCYNGLGFKRVPVLDLLNQVGYLLIFVLASWLCSVEQLSPAAMTFSALFAMHSHLFGQIVDMDEDRAAGRRTTAVVFGTRASKWVLAGFLAVESVIAGLYFDNYAIAIAMTAGAAWFSGDAAWNARKYSIGFVKTFFVGWNLVVLLSMYFVWRDGLLLSG